MGQEVKENQEYSRILIFWTAWLIKLGPTGCPETSPISYLSTQRKILEKTKISHIY
jgi:hypothetical protein